MDRRDFLTRVGASAAAYATPPAVAAEARFSAAETFGNLDLSAIRDVHRLRITPISLEIADRRTMRTVGYNGGSPGPVVRMRAGLPTALEVFNNSDYPETVHPHGQHVSAEIDGTPHEKSPIVAPGGKARFLFEPGPPGTRWYHSHAITQGERTRALYTGQQGVLIVEGKDDPGAYDREVILITHDWRRFIDTTEGKDAPGPTFSIMEKRSGSASRCESARASASCSVS